MSSGCKSSLLLTSFMYMIIISCLADFVTIPSEEYIVLDSGLFYSSYLLSIRRGSGPHPGTLLVRVYGDSRILISIPMDISREYEAAVCTRNSTLSARKKIMVPLKKV